MVARHPSVRFLAVSDKDPARAKTLADAVIVTSGLIESSAFNQPRGPGTMAA